MRTNGARSTARQPAPAAIRPMFFVPASVLLPSTVPSSSSMIRRSPLPGRARAFQSGGRPGSPSSVMSSVALGSIAWGTLAVASSHHETLVTSPAKLIGPPGNSSSKARLRHSPACSSPGDSSTGVVANVAPRRDCQQAVTVTRSQRTSSVA